MNARLKKKRLAVWRPKKTLCKYVFYLLMILALHNAHASDLNDKDQFYLWK